MEYQTNAKLKIAEDYIQFTDKNIFLTGKAGTGKTTFLKNLKENLHKRLIVVAPTGVAAINAGGVTLHSFFQLSFGPAIPFFYFPNAGKQGNGKFEYKFGRDKINIIRSLDLLVIDEISMVRADVLDSMDQVLRRYRNSHKPFGGVQLLMIGDIQQLSPIMKDDEWGVLQQYYTSPYFFSSNALKEAGYVGIELTQVYRQNDEKFISLLNDIRTNDPYSSAIEDLNERFDPNFKPDEEEGYITLTTHNSLAEATNENKLKELSGSMRFYNAKIEGDFPQHSFPTKQSLDLKVGAQVMFLKNDPTFAKAFYNGKIGKVVKLGDDFVEVKCPSDEDSIVVKMLDWKNYKYTIDPNTNEIQEIETGVFKQIPLKLAWAITIHKSQGLTFDKVIIDAQGAFSHGQVYVALSRCRSLDGLVLSSLLSARGLVNNQVVNEFEEDNMRKQPSELELYDSKVEYQHQLLNELLDFNPISKRLNNLAKIVQMHSKVLLGNPNQFLQELKLKFEGSIKKVAEKFILQLNQLINSEPDIGKNQALQTRIAASSSYFLTEIDVHLAQVLSKFNIESDNKKISQDLIESLSALNAEIEIKIACFIACENGLDIKAFQKARAEASIEKVKEKAAKKVVKETVSTDVKHPILFERLKKWRTNKSAIIKIAAYMIMHQRALIEIANKLPINMNQLSAINGVGKSTLDKYGEEILALILVYRNENKVEAPDVEVINSQELESKKEPKISNKKISFDMFLDGATVQEIAANLELTVGTIEGHLAHYVGTGELNIDQFLPHEKIVAISKQIENLGNTQIAPIKAVLGDSFSYTDIKYGVKYWEYCESQN